MLNSYLNGLYRPALEKSDRDQYICLDKNEPPFSAFETIETLITDKDVANLRTYPSPYILYEKLSRFVGVALNQLLITNGSEQAIEFIFRVLLSENEEVVYLRPSFAMFDVFAYIQKAKVKCIDYDNIMFLSVQTVIDSISKETRLFVLANPNNPTGSAFNLEEIEKIAKHTQKTRTFFLLDEAYFHYYNIDTISLVDKYEHIIITRTFSKAFGIAGARVGYAISNQKNIELLRKIKPIDEINHFSNILAQKALDNADDILSRNINQVVKWKNNFKNATLNNLKYIETNGNFIILKSSTYEVHKEIFLENKILPKMDFPQEYLKNCFRFSILNDSVMNKILNILGSDNVF